MKTQEQLQDLAMYFAWQAEQKGVPKKMRRQLECGCKLLMWICGEHDCDLDEALKIASPRPRHRRTKKKIVREDAFPI